MLLRFAIVLFVISAFFQADIKAQEPVATPTPSVTPEATPQPTPISAEKAAPGTFTAEQIAESVIFIYGFGRGREGLAQIRKTTFERGKTVVTNDEVKRNRPTISNGSSVAKRLKKISKA